MPSYGIRGKALEQEFQDLLHKQAIEQAPQTPGFYSRLFVVQRDSGAWCPIIGLSTLNTYIASSRTACIQARDRLLQVCEELGLQVNFKKSSLIPSQDMTYLGMQIQSVRFIAKPTEMRVENLLKVIEEFLSSPGPPAALWRHLLGHLSSLTLLVKGGMLRMRSLQLRLRSRWDFRDELLRIPWDPLCQEDLLW